MAKGKAISGTPFRDAGHDHGTCIHDALERAAQICTREGARLTALRRDVLGLIWRGHTPVGAYAVLDELKRHHHGAAPATVYRSLDFLIHHGLIHRISSRNAYVGCSQPERKHVSQFLICDKCSAAAEFEDEDILDRIEARADALGFALQSQTIELSGLCPQCRVTS